MSAKKKQHETLFQFVNAIGLKNLSVNWKTLFNYKNIGYITRMFNALSIYRAMTDSDGDLIIPSMNISNPSRIDFEIDDGTIFDSKKFSDTVTAAFSGLPMTIKEDQKIKKVIVRIKLGVKSKGDSK